MKKGWSDTTTPRRLSATEVEHLAATVALIRASQNGEPMIPHMPTVEECLAAGSGAVRIANNKAFGRIESFRVWRGSNFWGEWERHIGINSTDGTGFRYAVFSYRRSWPLLIFDLDALVWCACAEKYSRSTTAHMQSAHPEWFRPIWMDNSTMEEVHRSGYVGALSRKIERA